MFGIMGLSAAFTHVAGRGGRPYKGNMIVFKESIADPILYQLSCTGTITIQSIKNGEVVKQTYTDLNNTQVSIQADANTNITIFGDVTNFHNAHSIGGYIGSNYVTELDITKCLSLTKLGIEGCADLQSIDTSLNSNLTSITIFACSNIQSINVSSNFNLQSANFSGNIILQIVDLSKNAALASLNLNYDSNLTTLYYPATNDTVSTAIAGAITAATAADGTVYTDSAGAYYSTIADAATAKGWTIEQL